MAGKLDRWPDVVAEERRNPGSADVSDAILNGIGDLSATHLSPKDVQSSLAKVKLLRDELRRSWVGLEDERLGHLTDWVLATILARENPLLLGPPGSAKTEIALRTFELLGLRAPEVDEEGIQSVAASVAKDPTLAELRTWWKKRAVAERRTQKVFHVTLSRLMQVEELVGPIEIGLLRKGYMVRVNFAFLTGPGVRAAFLDEVFKAAANLLNTLLTLLHERRYFNWGGMERADLQTVIGASNEMPGGFGTGQFGQGSGGEDFQALHAFVDRFPLRLQIPSMSGSRWADEGGATSRETQLAHATRYALQRERDRFCTGRSFRERGSDMPSINDLLLLGRFCYQSVFRGTAEHVPGPFDRRSEDAFWSVFCNLASSLQQDATNHEQRRVRWTISPRKLRALYKIALAHALVHGTAPADQACPLGQLQLKVFETIWDTPGAVADLRDHVDAGVKQWWKKV